MKEAQLYEVLGTRGDLIFAIFDPHSKWVWTERSERAARQVADEKGYQITEGGQITHAQLLHLIGQDSVASSNPPFTKAVEAEKPVEITPALPPTVMPVEPATEAAAPLPKVVYHWENEDVGETAPFTAVLPDLADVGAIGPLGDIFKAAEPLIQPENLSKDVTTGGNDAQQKILPPE